MAHTTPLAQTAKPKASGHARVAPQPAHDHAGVGRKRSELRHQSHSPAGVATLSLGLFRAQRFNGIDRGRATPAPAMP
jgi:hypothetical protein